MILGKVAVIFRIEVSNVINESYSCFFFLFYLKRFLFYFLLFLPNPMYLPWAWLQPRPSAHISQVTDDFTALSISVPDDLQLLGLAPCPIQSPHLFPNPISLCQRTNCYSTLRKIEIDGGSSVWRRLQERGYGEINDTVTLRIQNERRGAMTASKHLQNLPNVKKTI